MYWRVTAIWNCFLPLNQANTGKLRWAIMHWKKEVQTSLMFPFFHCALYSYIPNRVFHYMNTITLFSQKNCPNTWVDTGQNLENRWKWIVRWWWYIEVYICKPCRAHSFLFLLAIHIYISGSYFMQTQRGKNKLNQEEKGEGCIIHDLSFKTYLLLD